MLARVEQISPQSMGATLGGLEARGLVDRRPDPEDGRRVVLSVTEAGLEVLRNKRTARIEQLAQALSEGFTPTELEGLMAFRRHHLPVVLVNVTGGAPGRTETGSSRPADFTPPPDWAELADELNAQPEDHLVTKRTWGAFHETALHARLQELGVTQIVLTGVATSAGVESTARAAHEHGYHVVLATDAMTDRDADAHQNSVERIFPKLGETATTDEILDLLEKTRPEAGV